MDCSSDYVTKGRIVTSTSPLMEGNVIVAVSVIIAVSVIVVASDSLVVSPFGTL